MRLCFLFSVCGIFGLSSAISAPQLDRVEFEGASLSEAVEYLREQAVDPRMKNIIVDPRIDLDREVTLYLNRISVGNALICLVDHLELDYRIESHAVLVVPQWEGLLGRRKPHAGEDVARFSDAKKAAGCVFDQVEFSDVPIKDVVKYISDRSAEVSPESGGINLVFNHYIDPDMPVSLKLEQVPVSLLLFQISKITQLEVRAEPYAICLDPPGTKALVKARRETKRRERLAKMPKRSGNGGGMRGKGYTIGSVPNDPRSPVHPDYVGSGAEDVRTRTNALNNVYKWVNGKWTFVRYGSGDPRHPSLDENGRFLITPTLDAAKLR